MIEALIAAIAALAGGWGGSLIGARAAVLAARTAQDAARETSQNARLLAQEEWFRSKRYEIYADVVVAARELLPKLYESRRIPPSESELAAVMGHNQYLMMALGKIVLVGPPQVVFLGEHLAEAATSAVQELMMLSPADLERAYPQAMDDLRQRAERLAAACKLFQECAAEIINQTRELPYPGRARG
ncbi:hypothetical protein [Streptomyces sp. NPDC002402]